MINTYLNFRYPLFCIPPDNLFFSPSTTYFKCLCNKVWLQGLLWWIEMTESLSVIYLVLREWKEKEKKVRPKQDMGYYAAISPNNFTFISPHNVWGVIEEIGTQNLIVGNMVRNTASVPEECGIIAFINSSLHLRKMCSLSLVVTMWWKVWHNTRVYILCNVKGQEAAAYIDLKKKSPNISL